jgi:hypothetical protein
MARKAAVLATSKKAPHPEPPKVRDPVDGDDSEIEDAPEGELAADAELSDNVGEHSVEINVETLIAELEADSHRGRTRDVHCARRKLEEYLERKRVAHDIEDFEDFEIDD